MIPSLGFSGKQWQSFANSWGLKQTTQNVPDQQEKRGGFSGIQTRSRAGSVWTWALLPASCCNTRREGKCQEIHVTEQYFLGPDSSTQRMRVFFKVFWFFCYVCPCEIVLLMEIPPNFVFAAKGHWSQKADSRSLGEKYQWMLKWQGTIYS